MDNLEKRQLQKETTRLGILNTAQVIAKQEGWGALSMRKIAGKLTFTPPIIYQHFKGKTDLLDELIRMGFTRLSHCLFDASKGITEPLERLESVWDAYWKFAFAEKEIYQLMFGIGVASLTKTTVTSKKNTADLLQVFYKIFPENTQHNASLACTYCACWSVVHGLIALNFLNSGGSATFNRKVLLNAKEDIKATFRLISFKA